MLPVTQIMTRLNMVLSHKMITFFNDWTRVHDAQTSTSPTHSLLPPRGGHYQAPVCFGQGVIPQPFLFVQSEHLETGGGGGADASSA